MLGKEILGYHVDEKIGSGVFGTVYKVSKTNVTGTYVRALKHIEVPTKRQYNNVLNSMGGDVTKADNYFANVLKNIVGEVKILSELSESGNRNIVRYYENDVVEQRSPKKYDIYILMEYLTPFPEYLDNTSLTVKDVIKLGKDILNALIACHEKNIIHRDIKDENIFVGPGGTYKIGDFGVSKELKDQSRAASIKGTPNFIAPEVYLGKDNYDRTVDLYSLGIVLYRLLNNLRNPFLPAFPNEYTSEDEDIAFEARMTGKIPELPNMAKNELGEAVLKAIRPREERYNTAEEFLEALEKAEKALAPVYLAQGIGLLNASQDNEETVSASNSDATVAICASVSSEKQKSNDDTSLVQTIALYSEEQDNDLGKMVAIYGGTNEFAPLHIGHEANNENDKKRRSKKKLAISFVAIILVAALLCGLFVFSKHRDDKIISEKVDTDLKVTDIKTTEEKNTEEKNTEGNGEIVETSNNNVNSGSSDIITQTNDTVYILYAAKIRETAKATGKVLTEVPFGVAVSRTEKNSKWSKVTYNGVTGYVMNDLITTNPDTVTFEDQGIEGAGENAAKVYPTAKLVGTVNYRLRHYPLADGYPHSFVLLESNDLGDKGHILGGTTVAILAISKDKMWAKISCNEVDVAVNGEYTKNYTATETGYILYSFLEMESSKKVLFGSYPQTEVTESALTATLNAKAGTLPTSENSQAWTSYGYYIEGNVENFMWYIDMTTSGEKYRGVYFTSYRPQMTTGSSETYSDQNNNGYNISTVYWFKYEPISWTILSEDTANGTALILCDMIIDSQEYYITNSGTRTIDGKTVYPNNYAESTIRKWLNETFYNTAFNELEKQIILTTTVDNSAATTGSSTNQYACENTQDKIFLLSYQDVINANYGFSSDYSDYDTARQKKTTDYAQAQGAGTSTFSSYAGNGHWWLRSPYDYPPGYRYAHDVGNNGEILFDILYYTNGGVVPALQIRI